MRFEKLNINNLPYIGIFVSLGKKISIVPESISKKEEDVLKDILDVECVKYNIANSHLNGAISKIINGKILLPKTSSEKDVDFLESIGLDVLVLNNYFAVGNLIATNQKEVLLSKEFDSKSVKKINEFLGLECEILNLGNVSAIGSSIAVNKNGFAVNPVASPKDIKKIENIFGVKGNIATINYGDGFIANGLLVNDHGIIVGKKTTGYELIRINDIFYS